MTGAARLALMLCVAEVVGMLGFAAFPALVPTFMGEWHLSATEAGWINGLYSFGYLVAVPVLVASTDRMAAKRIYLFCAVLTAAAMAGFAWGATGPISAAAFRAVAGIGLAGTYMPGLKVLSDALDDHPRQGRFIAFYTASFSIGSSLSFLFVGELAAAWNWHVAIGATAIGPLLAMALVLFAAPTERGRPQPAEVGLLDFRPVLACRPAMGFVFAYAAHCYELFALRAWIVAFLVFAGFRSAGGGILTATTIATVVNLIGLPASVFGNELAGRFGRVRTLNWIMGASAAIACVIGITAEMPMAVVLGACLVYGATVTGDSAALTTGLIENAPAGRRGAAMAVHSSIGFFGAFLGSLGFGAMLDATGGTESPLAWTAAFASTGLVVVLGPLALRWGRSRGASSSL